MARPKFGARLPRPARATEQKLAWFAWGFLLFFLFDVKGFMGRQLYRVADLANIHYHHWTMSSWPQGAHWFPDSGGGGISHMTNPSLSHAERSIPGGNPECRDRTGYGPHKAPDRQVHDFMDELWRKNNNPRLNYEPEMDYEYEDYYERQMDEQLGPFMANMLPAEEMTKEAREMSHDEWLDSYGHPIDIFQWYHRQGRFLEAVEKLFPDPERGSPEAMYKSILVRAYEDGYGQHELMKLAFNAQSYMSH